MPEHIWKNVNEEDVKTYANEPSGGKPVVGSGPFELIEGKADGDIYRFKANPDYWDGEPNVSEVDYRVYRSQDTLVQALKAGEIDFAEGVTPLQVDKLKSDSNITTVLGDSPGFDEIAFNTGSVDVSDCNGTDCAPMGDPNPAVLDPNFRFALNFAIDRQQMIDKVYQGAGKPGTTIIPPAYTQWQWKPDDPDAFAYDPEKAKQLLDDAGYKVGLTTACAPMPDGSPIGSCSSLRAPDSETSISTMNFFREWLKDVDDRLRNRLGDQQQGDQHHPRRQLRHLPVGLVCRARSGLDAELLHVRPARWVVGLLVLRPEVRPALRGPAL